MSQTSPRHRVPIRLWGDSCRRKAISHVFRDCVRILQNLKAAYLGSTHVEINPYLIQIKDLNDRGQTLRGYL